MSSSVVIEILLGLLTCIVGYFAYRGSNQVARAQANAAEADVDAQAYERAKTIYESAIDALEDHVRRLREQLEILDGELTKLQRSNAELKAQVYELQAANTRLEAELRSFKEGHPHDG
jgi:chromosome segregation ATPase